MSIQSNGHEHEFEAAYGLPEPLPQGEQILWQGAPDFKNMALRVFHLRKLVVYFALMIASRGIYLGFLERPGLDVLKDLALLVALATFALSALATLAWLTARTTAYTLTDQRVVMRIGIVLTLTFNLPLKQISNAGLQLTPDGFGDVPLALNGGDRIGWLNLWPHARPWRIEKPEPMLRCIAQAQAVATQLQKAWTAVNGASATATAAPLSAAAKPDHNWQAKLT